SVAPRRSSVEEVIRDGEDGLLFTPGDPPDLARALERLLDDAALREKCAESAYRRVRAEHPASATRRRLLEAYARLLPASSWAPRPRRPPAEPAAPAPAEPAEAVPAPVDESFSDEHETRPFGRTFADDVDDDEKTRPGPLRSRRPSG